MKYDFKAARNQIQELTLTYRSLNYRGMLNEQNRSFLLESINELESEIAAAKEKMAALDGHHFHEHNKNLITAIIPFNHHSNKGVPLNEYDYGA